MTATQKGIVVGKKKGSASCDVLCTFSVGILTTLISTYNLPNIMNIGDILRSFVSPLGR